MNAVQDHESHINLLCHTLDTWNIPYDFAVTDAHVRAMFRLQRGSILAEFKLINAITVETRLFFDFDIPMTARERVLEAAYRANHLLRMGAFVYSLSKPRLMFRTSLEVGSQPWEIASFQYNLRVLLTALDSLAPLMEEISLRKGDPRWVTGHMPRLVNDALGAVNAWRFVREAPIHES